MLPNDDDEFEGDFAALIPVRGTKLPHVVVATARQRLADLITAGTGEQHTTFYISYGGTTWMVVARQEASGGYRVLFDEVGGCRDKRAFMLVRKDDPSEDPKFYAYYTDSVEELIDPTEGQPRPEPETADRTIGYRVPPEIRNGGPSGYLTNTHIPASLFTGQMREAVQCIHLNKRNSPYSSEWGRSHGIVELPRPRVIGGTKAEEKSNHRQRKFWVVEISDQGVHAVRVRSSKNCCDSWVPTGIATKDGNGDYNKLNLAQYFNDNPSQTRVKRLLTSAAMSVIYDGTRFPVFLWVGWAYSYSGHEAQQVILKVDSGDSILRAWRYKIEFTPSGPDLAANIVAVESDVKLGRPTIYGPSQLNGAGTQFLYNTNTFPGSIVEPAVAWDGPLYVFYTGDTEKVLRYAGDDLDIVINTSLIPGGPTTSPFFNAGCCGTFDEYTGWNTGTAGHYREEGVKRYYIDSTEIGGDTYLDTVTQDFKPVPSVVCSYSNSHVTGTSIQSCHPPGAASTSGTISNTQQRLGAAEAYEDLHTEFLTFNLEIYLPFYDREAVLMREIEVEQITSRIACGISTLTQQDASGTFTVYDSGSVPIGTADCTSPFSNGFSNNLNPFDCKCYQQLWNPLPGECVFPACDPGDIGTTTTTTYTKQDTLVARSEVIMSGVAVRTVVDETPFVGPPSSTDSGYDRLREIYFFMGSGLFYTDPTLTPAVNLTNKVYLPVDLAPSTPVDVTAFFPVHSVTTGGFDKPNEYPEAFVGRI